MVDLEFIKADEELAEVMSETYAGNGETYADRLAKSTSVGDALEIITAAAFIARVSGDYLGASVMLEAYAAYRA
jgi:hypothetical protein